jgi:hypothetical protein
MAMQKITFSADSDLLDRAEQIAKAKGTTLEEEVRQWLDDFGEGRWKLPAREPRKRKTLKPVKDWSDCGKSDSSLPGLKGCLISKGLAASLKRRPDTKHELFSSPFCVARPSPSLPHLMC